MLARFDATHRSANAPRQAAPAAPAAAAPVKQEAAAAAGPVAQLTAAASVAGEGARPPKRSRQEEEGGVLRINVKQLNGRVTQVCVRPDAGMGTALSEFCRALDLEWDSMRFLYDAVRIFSHTTPRSLGMEDGANIDAFPFQVGD